jgi:hypothetical protein
MLVGYFATLLIAIGGLSIQTPEHSRGMVVSALFILLLFCGYDRQLDNEVVWIVFHFGLVKPVHLCYYISRQAPPRRRFAYGSSTSPIPLPCVPSLCLPPANSHSFSSFPH